MAIFPIRTFPDPVLRMKATPVEDFDRELHHLVADMLETMYAAPGVGLAANQIGVSLAVFVFDIGEGPKHVINPVMEETRGSWAYDEGCLSVPDHYWPITRPAFAAVTGVDMFGASIRYEGDELLGRVLQHEFDHLEGALLLNRLGRRARKQAMRELREEAMGTA
ncbi:MAG TPA: peptide deformylase [Acidimicrobiia bacterium]|nr:peptide deformylase [Acidimicrobiia bacterium]